MLFNESEYRNKVLGCWLGKNIGGTLGAPMEWRRQVNQVDFYTQDLVGEPLPNDDLDIQLLWLVALEEIQVCTGYKLNGSPVRYADVDAYGLETVELIYQTFPGWKEEISAARSFDDLPSNAQAYVKRIEEMAGVPVKWIGVGPEREATIRR